MDGWRRVWEWRARQQQQVRALGLRELVRRCAAGLEVRPVDAAARDRRVEQLGDRMVAAMSVAGAEACALRRELRFAQAELAEALSAAAAPEFVDAYLDAYLEEAHVADAAAVEGAAAMLYGISRAYKESANCRLEAQYAYQQQVDMLPLMMEEGYHPNGWLGMLVGVRLGCGCGWPRYS